MKIKRLSKETINLISAGEVIEGPSDVLKELLENSIDANSKEIKVNIKASGIELIEIQDDGSGIDKEDLEICLEKYTTSKINNINDLYKINTFGFRGEALSSIDAISKLEIITSTNNDGNGFILKNKKINSISSKKGSVIRIKDLFYNVPVRKKFLKSKSFEFSKIYDVFLAAALSNPKITFKFSSEKKNITFPKTDFENRFLQIFGFEIKSKTLKINFDSELFKVKGYITNPSNPIYLSSNFLFINKRYVFSTQIHKAIVESYKDYLMIQQKPFFIMFVDLNPEYIDVNVHPKKRIVKLLNETLFLTEFKKYLSNFLDKHLGKSLPETNYSSLKNFIAYDQKTNFSEQKNNFKTNFLKNTEKEVDYNFQKNFEKTPFDQSSEKIILFNHTITKFLGQIHDTFIICETTDGFILIDQHAADERINLEKNRVKYKILEKQKLISPLSLYFLTPLQKEVLKNNESKIKKIGFDFITKDNTTYLTTVPLFLNKLFNKNIFINLIDDLEKGTNDVLKLKDNLLKLKSCKESIKAKQKISLSDQINLVKNLKMCSDKGICAHGRPTIISISLKEVDKLFKRTI